VYKAASAYFFTTTHLAIFSARCVVAEQALNLFGSTVFNGKNKTAATDFANSHEFFFVNP
jgi:hypothetical protein